MAAWPGNNAAVGRQRVLATLRHPVSAKSPSLRDGVSERLHGPRPTLRRFRPGRVTRGPPRGDFATGATTSDRLSTFSRFGGKKIKRKKKDIKTPFSGA
jgi:hypothetical protein